MSVDQAFEKVISARGDKFEERLGDLISMDDAADWLGRLMRELSGFRKVVAIATIGERGAPGVAPFLREHLSAEGPGSRDVKTAAIIALSRCERDEGRLLLDVLELAEGADAEVAESASCMVEFCQNPEIVPRLETWLGKRLLLPRTKRQQRVVGNLLASCIRLGGDRSRRRLVEIASGSKLGLVEQMAFDGTWLGHRISGSYPIIDWPDGR